jgi:hypothetical protein
MDADGLLAAALALLCLLAVGMTATTIDASVETTPDDAIDISASSVPLGAGEMQEYKERIKSEGENNGPGDEERVTEAAVATDEGGDTRERSKAAKQGGAGAAAATTQGRGTGAYDPTLFEELLSLLTALLELLLSLLPVAALAAVIGGAVVYRDRLRETLGWPDDGAGVRDEADADPVPAPVPTNEVSRAWHEMAAKLDDRPERRTPRELVDAAVSAGVDPDPVERVTETFEEVRYGHAEVTEERCQRARRGLQAFRAEYGREGNR